MMVLCTQSQCPNSKFHYFMQINLLFASSQPIDFFQIESLKVPFWGHQTGKILNNSVGA